MSDVHKIPTRPGKIPVMDDPMGKYWEQPDRSEVWFNDTHAFMDQAAFDKLHEYSCSMPSGVYPGKMWMVDHSAYHGVAKDSPSRYSLRWYGESDEPDMCSNHQRTISIV